MSRPWADQDSAHVFADDLQVYCHFLDGKEQVALQLFRDCSESVSCWMSSNRLKLNPLKTELIWLHNSRRNPTFLWKDIVLFGSPITPVNVVRNSEVILDGNMTMSEHIARVCQNCYYQLCQIRRIKRSLTANSITLLVLASVHSRLDYCNSVLYSYLGRICSYCSLCWTLRLVWFKVWSILITYHLSWFICTGFLTCSVSNIKSAC